MIIDVILPQLGESVAEGTISKWLVREGDSGEKDQAKAPLATHQADRVPVAPPPPPAATTAPEAAPAPARAAMATPAVRKTALENDVDLGRVQGTGDRGRVTKDDVLRAAGAPPAPAIKERQSTPPPAIEPPQARPTSTPPAQQVA